MTLISRKGSLCETVSPIFNLFQTADLSILILYGKLEDTLKLLDI